MRLKSKVAEGSFFGVVWFDAAFFCHVVTGAAAACPFREPCSRQRPGAGSRCLQALINKRSLIFSDYRLESGKSSFLGTAELPEFWISGDEG